MSTTNNAITNELLIEASARKLAEGVSKARLFQLIDEFASSEHWRQRSGAVGRRLLEDIPQDRRQEFLNRVAAL
jgi:hypothetical protein